MAKPLSNTHNCHLSNFLGSLRVAQQKKKVTFSYWPCPKLVISVANALRDEGFIFGYTLTPERETIRIEIRLKYYNTNLTPLITCLKIYASPSRQYNCSYRHLVKLSLGKSDKFFLSTAFGIKTSDYCLSHLIGGNLLFKIR